MQGLARDAEVRSARPGARQGAQNEAGNPGSLWLEGVEWAGGQSLTLVEEAGSCPLSFSRSVNCKDT